MSFEQYIAKRFRGVRNGDTWTRWARVGLVQILSEQWNVAVPLQVAQQCLLDLEVIGQDVEFVSSWREPREFMRMLRDCWGWLAGALAKAWYKTIEVRKRNDRKSAATKRRRRRLWRAPTEIYSPIFGPATRRGREGRRMFGLKKLPMPKELAAALSKTLKAATMAADERAAFYAARRKVRRRAVRRGRRTIRTRVVYVRQQALEPTPAQLKLFHADMDKLRAKVQKEPPAPPVKPRFRKVPRAKAASPVKKRKRSG